MKKRIRLIGGSAGCLGGVERHCQRFIEALGREGKLEIEWIQTNTAIFRNGRLAGNAWNCLVAHLRLARRCRRAGDEGGIYWVQYGNFFDLLTVALISLVCRNRLVVLMHVGPQWTHLRLGLLKRLSHRLLRRAAAIGVLSAWQERHLQDGGLGRVVLVPTLLPEWINQEAEAPGDGAASGGRKKLLYFGRITREKGIEDILAAFRLIEDECRDLEILLVGQGSQGYTDRIRREIASPDLGGRVHLLGAMNERELRSVIVASRALVYPSLADAYPLAVLEALALGRQVIAYDIPGTSEILDAYQGIKVAAGDVPGLAKAMLAIGKADRSVEWPSVGRSDGAVQRQGVCRELRRRLGWDRVAGEYRALAFSEGEGT